MLKVLGFNLLHKLNTMYLNDLSYLPIISVVINDLSISVVINNLSISVVINDLSKHAVCYTQ